jgi:hypothetical protein
VTTTWTLHDLAFSDRARAFLFNIARVTYQLLLFPLSTFKKDLWMPDIFRSKFATGGGTTYSLIEVHTQDSAYPSWIALSLLAICLVSTIYLVLWRRDMLRKYFLAPPVSISLAVLLLTSVLTTAVIFWNIAYQPWMSRFIGCIYIPLFPIMAYQLGILMTAIMRYVSGQFASFLCLAALSVLTVGDFMHSLNLVDGQINVPRLMLGFNNNPESSYRAHLANQGISSVEIESLIKQLRTTKYESLVLCHEENSWNLVPVYEASINASFNGRNLSTQRTELCPTGKKGILMNASDGVTYVILP